MEWPVNPVTLRGVIVGGDDMGGHVDSATDHSDIRGLLPHVSGASEPASHYTRSRGLHRPCEDRSEGAVCPRHILQNYSVAVPACDGTYRLRQLPSHRHYGDRRAFPPLGECLIPSAQANLQLPGGASTSGGCPWLRR